MADEPTPTPDDPTPPPDKPEQTDTPPAVAKNTDDVDAMKTALHKANKEAETARLKLKEIEDRDKTDSEKLTERLTTAEKRATDAEHRALRLEVAAGKGLTPIQAKRLVGTTPEELEADADELLATFVPNRPNVTGRPSPALRGGGDPTEDVEETDPAKLAAAIRVGQSM